jgi:hypothetical protein
VLCVALTSISQPIVDHGKDGFRNQFDEAFVYSLYGEAEHWVLVRWTANSLTLDTDLFGGASTVVHDERTRIYMLRLLQDIYVQRSDPYEPYRCSRFNVRAEFFRGKEQVFRRACLFPADTGLTKSVMTLFRVLGSFF